MLLAVASTAALALVEVSRLAVALRVVVGTAASRLRPPEAGKLLHKSCGLRRASIVVLKMVNSKEKGVNKGRDMGILRRRLS